jgi:hypothetical protein
MGLLPASAPAAATAATATTATARAVTFRTSFVDGERPAHVFLAIEVLNRSLSLLLLWHLDKAEAPWPTGELVGQKVDCGYIAVCGKELTHFVFHGLKRQIANINVHMRRTNSMP